MEKIAKAAIKIPLDLLGHLGEIPGGTFQRLLPDADTERLNADVVNVMGLVEHNDAFLLHLLGYNGGHLGVEQVLVAVDHDIGVANHLPGKEVGAPALVTAKSTQIT